MRLIITGGLGHIGSGLLSDINNIKNLKEIVVLDYAISNKKHVFFNLKIKAKIRFIEEDILSFDLNKIIKTGDIIIHFAAITNAVESFKIKKKLIKNNFLSTKKIVDVSTKKKLDAFFYHQLVFMDLAKKLCLRMIKKTLIHKVLMLIVS